MTKTNEYKSEHYYARYEHVSHKQDKYQTIKYTFSEVRRKLPIHRLIKCKTLRRINGGEHDLKIE